MKRLRFFLMTLILCVGAAILTLGLSTADLSSKSALDHPEKQIAFAFSPTHKGLSLTLFNDSYRLDYPLFLQKIFGAVKSAFIYIADFMKLLQRIIVFLRHIFDRLLH